jgi:FkbM family methyltransferase
MSIYNALAWYYDLYGFRGVLAVAGHRLLGQPKEVAARLPGIQNPIHLRIGTTDEFIYRSVLLKQEYAFDLPFCPKTIVDAGANIGTTSIYFANKYPGAKIIAIEAEASNFAVLSRNVRPYPAITPVHAALWNRDGEISVGKPDPASGAFGEWGFVTSSGGTGPKVRAVTMPTLMREMNIQTIDLAKIDIEGAEQEVFEDTSWLSGTGCLMIELHDRFRSGCSEAVERAMHGFARSERGETTFYVRMT